MTDLPVPQPAPTTIERIEDLVQRTQRTVLESVEAILKRQMQPFLDHARQTILDSLDVVVHKHADTLLSRLKGVSLDLVEEILKRQLEPFLGRAKQMAVDGLENAGFVQKYVDSLTAGLKKITLETMTEVVRGQVPDVARRFGRRVVASAAVVTLSCLAGVFLLVGGVLGLQAAGLPPYATYLIGAAVAAGAAWALSHWRS